MFKPLKVSKSSTISSDSPGKQSSQASKPFTSTSYSWADKLTKDWSENTSGTGSSKEFIPTLSYKNSKNSRESIKPFIFSNLKPSSVFAFNSSILSNNMKAILPVKTRVNMPMSGRISNSHPSVIKNKSRKNTILWKRCSPWPRLPLSVSKNSIGQFLKKYSLGFPTQGTTSIMQLPDSKASFSTNTQPSS